MPSTFWSRSESVFHRTIVTIYGPELGDLFEVWVKLSGDLNRLIWKN